MTEMLYYSTFATNILFSLLLAKSLKKSINSNKIKESKAKNIHSTLMLPLGALCGSVYFWLLIEVLRKLGQNITYGHGEILIAAIVFNIILSLVLIIIGRVYIGWKQVSF